MNERQYERLVREGVTALKGAANALAVAESRRLTENEVAMTVSSLDGWAERALMTLGEHHVPPEDGSA